MLVNSRFVYEEMDFYYLAKIMSLVLKDRRPFRTFVVIVVCFNLFGLGSVCFNLFGLDIWFRFCFNLYVAFSNSRFVYFKEI